MQRVFGHRPLYLVAADNEGLVDVLPLFLVRFPLLGSKLVSTPYEGCYGGFISDDPMAREALVRAAIDLAKRKRAKYLEIRNCAPIAGLVGAGFIEMEPLMISEVELVDEEVNFRQLSSKHRRNVRAAVKKRVEVSEATGPSEMRRFHQLVFDHYHDLGLPFFSRKYFDEIWSSLVMTGKAVLQVAHIDNEFVGGHLLFHSGSDLISKYAAYSKSDRFRKSYVSYAMFWEAIRYGIDRGFSTFNMGVTGESNTGLLDFKKRFGSQTRPIQFYYYPIRGHMPDYSQLYGGYHLIKQMWRLTPSFIAKPIGQVINSWFC
jgi:lipid II:glycine glycyltransferase (peptidoglycan interpeptide bridge formation enzyme)